MNNTYVLIMAGGEGTRFAPLSTPEKPKQFLNFVGSGSFLQQTRARIADLVPAEKIFVATNERYSPLVREQLPDIPKENIVAEPVKKNTAPCIAYAARLIHERDESAVMVVLPSDHVIGKKAQFLDTVRAGVETVRDEKCLLTLGIQPEWPSSDYGYIKASAQTLGGKNIARGVERFVEKPDEVNAQRYIEQGNYYWNSGMFLWSTEDILRELSLCLPDMYALLENFSCDDAFMRVFFEYARGISIDYGVMEKTKKAAVVPCALDWSDVGTWEGLYRLFMRGDVVISKSALRAMRENLGYISPSLPDPRLPRYVDKPWGHEEIWAHTSDYVGKVLSIKKGCRLSYQYHRVKEETIRVLNGIMMLECEGNEGRQRIELREGDVFHIPPRMRHRFIAVDDCRILEASTAFIADVVRLEDDFGRTKAKTERGEA